MNQIGTPEIEPASSSTTSSLVPSSTTPSAGNATNVVMMLTSLYVLFDFAAFIFLTFVFILLHISSGIFIANRCNKASFNRRSCGIRYN